MEPLLLSVKDARRALNIGHTTVYKLIGEGKLEVIKLGRKTLIKASSIRAVAGEAA